METMMERFAVLLATALVAGCGTMVETHVSSFHALDAPQGRTFAIIPLPDQQGSLEHVTYSRSVAAELVKRGLVQQATTPDIAVFLKYSIDGGRDVSSTVPIIGQTGVASSTTYGSAYTYGRTTTLNATTYNTPTYGVVGAGSRTDTVYTRTLSVEMFDASSLAPGAKPKKLYESQARSEGSSGQLAVVMPALVESTFADFPGESGRSKVYKTPLPSR